MTTSYLESLYTKVDQAVKETNTLIDFLETNVKTLAFSQDKTENGPAFNSYCQLLSDIKRQAGAPPNTNSHDIPFITQQLKETPHLFEIDFKFDSTLPVFGIMKLRRIASLIKKLRVVDAKLQAAAFSLNRNIK